MIVRIRFRRGPRIQRRKGKNSRIAWLAAGLLTLGSVSCLTLGIWRLGVDFGWAGEFVFPADSFLSHWQVWFGAATLVQYAAWKLNHYGTPAQVPVAAPAAREKAPVRKMAANA